MLPARLAGRLGIISLEPSRARVNRPPGAVVVNSDTHMVVMSPLVKVSPSPAHSCIPMQADPSSHLTPLNQLRQYFVLP